MFTDNERRSIQAIVDKAIANVVPLAEVMRLAQRRIEDGVEDEPANVPNTLKFRSGYRVTYTHEEQRQCVCRHISISVWKRGKKAVPREAVEILKAYGFINGVDKLPRWLSMHDTVVEFIEPVDGDLSKIARRSTQ